MLEFYGPHNEFYVNYKDKYNCVIIFFVNGKNSYFIRTDPLYLLYIWPIFYQVRNVKLKG